MPFGVNTINDELYIEKVPVQKIAESVGTPCYIYSYSEIEKRFNSYKTAFSDLAELICFSVKANSNIAVLKAFANLDSGFDIVSSGELRRVLMAGGSASKTVFSGVGKTDDEITEAIDNGILFFNVESEQELGAINRIARKMDKKAPIALRVNPDVDPSTHPYISTGFKKSKFGIEIGKAVEVYRHASEMSNINIVAIDAHIGSQIFELNSFTDSLNKLIDLAKKLRDAGTPVKYIDIGGGLGISYKKDEEPPTPADYADVVRSTFPSSDYGLILEPGRSLVGNCGIMTSKVIYIKQGTAKKFLVVDAAMNDLLRPSFYSSYHEIVPVRQHRKGAEKVDIVGPICESGDFLAQDREFPEVEPGDYIAVMSAGAYGFVMASNYNTRPRAAEVMVKEDQYSVIREREKFEDLVRGEKIPGFLE